MDENKATTVLELNKEKNAQDYFFLIKEGVDEDGLIVDYPGIFSRMG